MTKLFFCNSLKMEAKQISSNRYMIKKVVKYFYYEKLLGKKCKETIYMATWINYYRIILNEKSQFPNLSYTMTIGIISRTGKFMELKNTLLVAKVKGQRREGMLVCLLKGNTRGP